MRYMIGLSAVAVALTIGAPAYAQQTVRAATDLNVRTGPGPQYEVVGVIGADQSAQLEGCLQASKWCQVSFEGGQGWAYSDYLVADYGGRDAILTEHIAEAPVVKHEGGTTAGGVAGAATGAVAGAIVGGPIGAAIGGIAGAATGSIAGSVVNPPDTVRTYVREHRADPIYLDGEVVVGATLPENVEVRRIPDYEYEYVYVNQVPVLVEPSTRRIVYVLR